MDFVLETGWPDRVVTSNGLGVTTIAEPLSGSNFFGPFDRLEQTWTFSRPIVIDLDELAATVSAAAA
jgi:hypothetical protein